MKSQKLFIVLGSFIFISICNVAKAQLADSYPNDLSIETDADVLFVEKFNDGMTNIIRRYNEKINTAGMSLDRDVPPGSLEQFSLKMTSLTGGVNDGGYLFKRFTPGFDSTIFVRYYVKYPSTSFGYFHHEGVWFGGYSPALDYPFPRAGTCGLGSSRISIAYENVWQAANPPGMDTYLYWGDMHSYDGGTTCFGNTMINEGSSGYGNPPASVPPVDNLDKWMCVEIMIKLNNPVTAYNGELKIWQNGILVGYWGPGFPNGHWLKDKWYNNPSDLPFQGFRWRTDANMNINWLWFEFFHDNPGAPSSSIKFAHLVVAKKYIGPIHSSVTGINNPEGISAIRVFPNPSSRNFNITGLPLKSELRVFNTLGEEVISQKPCSSDTTIDLTDFPSGIYFVKIIDESTVYTEKIVLK
jgi:hypothetical protein